jgi:PTS system nitrogen regulatory IIA component
MKICDILPPSGVICDLTGSTAQDALAELSQPLAAKSGLEAKFVLAALRSREELGSTGLGDGFAIPHARVPGITGLVTSFGRSRAGIDFKAMDGKPTHFFFALCAPDGAPPAPQCARPHQPDLQGTVDSGVAPGCQGRRRDLPGHRGRGLESLTPSPGGLPGRGDEP